MISAWVQVLTVAFHESGHVLAGLATCARITSVEVDPELGGLTQMRGGIQWITLPAGAPTAIPLHEHNGLQHCTSAWLWGPSGKLYSTLGSRGHHCIWAQVIWAALSLEPCSFSWASINW